MEFFLLEDPKDVCAAIAMNEKIAGLSFPDAKGRLDFNGAFTSENPLFIRWCQDLFLVHRNKKGRIIKL